MVLTNPSVIKEIRQKFGFEFKKSFGQNFLTSERVLEDICNAAEGADGVLEIGPGFGTLTSALAPVFEKIVAIEVDSKLPEVLEYTLAEHSNIKVIQGDCMKMNLRELLENEFSGMKVSVAANLPYYITTPIITMLLENKLPLEKIVVMVQKEVAERLCASPGGKEYGAISVMCKYYTDPEIVSVVPSGCFIPAPKVDSAVVAMSVRSEPAVKVIDEKCFFAVVKAAFSQRRKTLCNCLCNSFRLDKTAISELLLGIDINPVRRGETLSIDEFAAISDKIISGGLYR